MRSALTKLEAAFPKLGNGASAQQRVSEIVGYLFQQKEALQVALTSLTRENFSTAGYERLVEDVASRVAAKLKEGT